MNVPSVKTTRNRRENSHLYICFFYGKKPLNKQNMPKSPSSMLLFDLSVICHVVKL